MENKKYYPIARPVLSLGEREYLLKEFESGLISPIGEFIEIIYERFIKCTGIKYALATLSWIIVLYLSFIAYGIKGEMRL